MKKIKIGACDWGLPGSGLFSTRIAAEYGLQALSLKIGLYQNNYPIAEPVMQKYYLNEQQKYGVEFCSIALNDFDNIPMHAREQTAEYEKAWTILNKGLQTAVALEIPLIQVPGFAVSEIKTGEDLVYSAKAFQYLCDQAGERGIMVAAENVMNPPEFKNLFDLVDRKNFGLYFDTQNYHLQRGYDQLEMLDGLFPYMVNQLHVKDGKGDALSGSLLGTGDVNFLGVMEKLGQKNFRGYLILENYYDQLPLRLEDENPYKLLEKDIATLKAAVDRFL